MVLQFLRHRKSVSEVYISTGLGRLSMHMVFVKLFGKSMKVAKLYHF
jgi:hypothetical protein